MKITLESRGICDFCSQKPVVARYHAGDFEVRSLSTEVLSSNSVGDWGACAKCEALIDAGDWNGVVKRALDCLFVESPELAVGRDDLTIRVAAMYQQMRDRGFRKGEFDGVIDKSN